MNTPPDINDSSREQREAYIEQRFRCISNCELCGNCAILHGREAEDVYSELYRRQEIVQRSVD